MQKHGGKTLRAYAQDFLDVNRTPLLDVRKNELIDTAESLIAERLGSDVAAGVAAQLRSCALVSTTDHHSIIQHPFWVNANIISALPYRESAIPNLRYLVVFSFAGVSLNNASGYPRGLLFHSGTGGLGNLVKLPLLSDKMKMSTVYATRAYTREDVEQGLTLLNKKERLGEVTADRANGVRALTHEFLLAPDVLAEKDFSSQITAINYRLWPRLFHSSRASSTKAGTTIPSGVPDLIYLEIETLVRELLLRFHLKNSNSFITKLLFNDEWRKLALEHFDGIHGAFQNSTSSGTYFFWGIDSKGHRVRLRIEGKDLVSHDGTMRFPLTPASIASALTKREIFPSMLLSYLMVSLYYGMKCLGGFCQVHDLTMTKKAWQLLLQKMGEKAEAEAIEPVQTRELGGDGLVLAYLQTQNGELVTATGVDMALDDVNTSYGDFVELSKKLTLSEAMNPLLPEMYTVLYTADERVPRFADMKPEWIMEVTGLKKKLEQEIRSLGLSVVRS
jgi:hypothetical protein